MSLKQMQILDSTEAVKQERPAPCARHCEANAFQIVIKNLKAQLAQPKQEPVANRLFLEKMLAAMEGVIDVADRKTDEFEALRSCVVDLTLMLHSIPQRTEQEPVIDKSAAKRIATALGWTPQRTWVGLTDEERKDIELGIEVFAMSVEDILKETEAKLKEKNT